MKVLSLLYYDDFARFFAKVEDGVREIEPGSEFLHLAIYPSGFCFLKIQGRNVIWVPWLAANDKSGSEFLTNEDLEKLLSYQVFVQPKLNESEKARLVNQAYGYLNAIKRLVKEFNPDVALISGDARMVGEAAKMACASFAIPCLFFEQGPNGTTIIDAKGVNANCSFRDSLERLKGESSSLDVRAPRDRYRRKPYLRGFDYISFFFLGLIGKIPVDLENVRRAKCAGRVYKAALKDKPAVIRRRTILIALQVPDDVNNVHHNPYRYDEITLLEALLNATDAQVSIVVREHPLYRKRYKCELYSKISSNDRVSLSSSTLDEDLARADGIVTINSMTGLDAYLKGKKVLVMGDSFYDRLPGIFKIVSPEHLRELLGRLSSWWAISANKNNQILIFNEFREKYLIDGHFRDEDLVSARRVAQVLLDHVR